MSFPMLMGVTSTTLNSPSGVMRALTRSERVVLPETTPMWTRRKPLLILSNHYFRANWFVDLIKINLGRPKNVLRSDIPRFQPHKWAAGAVLQTLFWGKFLEWTSDVMHSNLTWRWLIFGMSDGELRVSLQAITNTTPSPDNLRRWGNSEIDSACSLCGQPCTLRHVLIACKVSLLEERYLWRHNLILGYLQNYLQNFWSSV